MKTGIIGILNNPATSKNSHSAGMVHIVSKLYDAKVLTEKDNWLEYEKLIIYHGVNFKPGVFNVIGGINDGVLLRAKKLNDYINSKTEQDWLESVFSLDGFQLNGFSIKRKLNLYDDAKDISVIPLAYKENLVIGDSHSLSIWPNEEYTISRNDGKTLHGFLKQNRDLSDYNKIIFYFGNIDLRFHLARQENPIEATRDLFKRYVDYASKYDCTLVQLLPVEDESRILPKSGQYKGQNFYGSLELRKQLRLEANKIIIESGLPTIDWPLEYLDNNGNLSFDVMEPKQSVHLKPEFYLRNFKRQLTLF